MSGALEDRVIIVTGAAAGIGLGIAQMCTKAGATVAGFDIAAGFDGYAVDVADPSALRDAIAQVRKDHGRLDGIVNNAGVTLTAPFLEAPLDQWETLWQINQRAVLVGCQAAARIMVADGTPGAMVNIASNHAGASDAGYEAYAATKGAITAMTRAMSWSLGAHGIRVNALCPGLTMTDAVSQVAEDPVRAAQFKAWHATGRVNAIQDVGSAAVFLLSDASSALTGTDIIADQGMSSRLGALGLLEDPQMSKVILKDVVKKYGEVQVIHGVNLAVDQGDFVVFVGPSGCGKSTLLRMVAGLEDTTAGTISIGARDVTHVDPAKRGVAMVFQTYALYPHMTVRNNISFGLKMGGMSKDDIKTKVDAAARILKLDDYLDRKPKALSGGQRQRVAIGRAIVREPEVFLFDEPLSNLDAELRVKMRLEIARLHKDLSATMIYVTHDQVEAMTLADKIVVLRAGRVEQFGTPLDLYEDPDNLFVAQFIGSPRMNMFRAVGRADGSVCLVDFAGVTFQPTGGAVAENAQLLVGIRPENLSDAGAYPLNFHVDVVENLGGVSYAYTKECYEDEPYCIELRGKGRPNDGPLTIYFDAGSALLFDAESGLRLR